MNLKFASGTKPRRAFQPVRVASADRAEIRIKRISPVKRLEGWNARRGLAVRGYTLIELLLYMSMIGALLTGISLFFVTITNARVKEQTINEVNQQGALIMDNITQTIRNATSITTPAAGASGASLTLVVPTGALSPTIFDVSVASGSTLMGLNTDAGANGTSMSNTIDATSFVASATGTTTNLFALIGATVATTPNNKGQMAIYSGATPTTLLASSAAVTLTANTWNSFPIASVNITSGTTYWLSYNTNGLGANDNNVRQHTVGPNQSRFFAQTYNTWPASWAGTASNYEMSVYAMIATAGGTPGIAQVKEGAGSTVPLSNSKVVVSGLTFKNLTRATTPGTVQVSFVVTRVNANNRNEYDYQKTFTSTATVRP